MNIHKAKQIQIESVLKKLNYNPSKTIGNDYWYCSPLRDEQTPSFKVNIRINRWFDHGIQKGGNIVDFIIAKFNLTISEALIYLKDFDSEKFIFSFQKQENFELNSIQNENNIEIKKITEIKHYALKQYLEKRKIFVYKNELNLKEVHYKVKEKIYFGIGFCNRINGFEIRNKYAKICLGNKDITLIENQSNVLRVFEGFFDYLSFKQIQKKLDKKKSDYLILNSIGLLIKNEALLSEYETVELYLDNDNAGDNCTKIILEKFKNAVDYRTLYKEFNDLNEWLIINLKI